MLASIQRITEVLPIDGADKIVACRILGYTCVMRKEEAVLNGLVVFHAPDTIVNGENPAYEFLRKNNWRLKTTKLRGCVSQGLAMPLGMFPELDGLSLIDNVEGKDVTDIVGIKKWEKPAPKAQNAKGNFPSWLKKTDEDNGLSYPRIVEELKHTNCYAATKFDGSSMTAYVKDGEFGVCSRNLELKEDDNPYWHAAQKYDLKAKLLEFGKGRNIAAQMELIGPGVQGNKMGIKETEVRVFDIFDINAQCYMGMECLCEFAAETKIPIVKIVWAGIFDFTLKELVEMSNKQEYSPGIWSEGLIWRSCIEKYSQVLKGRTSFKILNENFLLRHGE